MPSIGAVLNSLLPRQSHQSKAVHLRINGGLIRGHPSAAWHNVAIVGHKAHALCAIMETSRQRLGTKLLRKVDAILMLITGTLKLQGHIRRDLGKDGGTHVARKAQLYLKAGPAIDPAKSGRTDPTKSFSWSEITGVFSGVIYNPIVS